MPPWPPIVDHDAKSTRDIDAVFAAECAEVQRVGPKAPNRSASAERFAQARRHELLDLFVVFGERHLRHLLSEFLPPITRSGRTKYFHEYADSELTAYGEAGA